MRIRDLFEDESNDFSDELVEKTISAIQQKCGPWLDQYGWDNVMLYRSSREWSAETYGIKPIRVDRKPKSTHWAIQDILVEMIIEEARRQGVSDPEGVANRNNSAFCYVGSGDWFYGKPNVFFPVGEFRTTYIEGVTDLYGPLPNTFKGRIPQLAFDDDRIAQAYRKEDGVTADEAKEKIEQSKEQFENVYIKDKVVFDSLKNFFGHTEERSEEVLVKASAGLYVNPELMDLVIQRL